MGKDKEKTMGETREGAGERARKRPRIRQWKGMAKKGIGEGQGKGLGKGVGKGRGTGLGKGDKEKT